jgi:2,3-dihydroxybiphenyl 1,2-dioxygenase
MRSFRNFHGVTARRTAMDTDRSSSPLHLAYLVVEARRPERWSAWCDTMLGAPPPSQLADGSQGWRIDQAAHRLIVQPGPADDLAAMGWACHDDAALDALVARLRSRGVPVTDATPAERAARRVKRLHHLRDPEGNAIELVAGLARADAPFGSPLFPAGFRSDETGFGHVALVARDLEAMQRFYVDELGFGLTEQLETKVGPLRVRGRFLHCNARHHSLALMALPLPRRLHHVMFEARDWRDVGAAFERARQLKVPLSLDLGQHPDPDGTFSFYGATPSGFDFEIGAGGRDIEPAAWRPLQSSVTSRWGHRPQLRLKWMTLAALLAAPWRRLRRAAV